ncbi:hypothetical protein V6N13_050344 [Hibiscus sabdariffa]
MLYDYLGELRLTNPGTTTICKLDDMVFEIVYICMQACKDGFKAGCRPIICLDGCHVKGYHKGHLLHVIGIDANNPLYLIAFAVVERRVDVLGELFPHSNHRTCVRNLYTNFKKQHTGKALKDVLWKAARATYDRVYEDAMYEVQSISSETYNLVE